MDGGVAATLDTREILRFFHSCTEPRQDVTAPRLRALKREREMREVSLEEICAATRIGTRFLEAMENEEWEKLPGGVFNRGFVRSVARYLGLDEETMLAEYDMARSHNGPPIASQPSQSIP